VAAGYSRRDHCPVGWPLVSRSLRCWLVWVHESPFPFWCWCTLFYILRRLMVHDSLSPPLFHDPTSCKMRTINKYNIIQIGVWSVWQFIAAPDLNRLFSLARPDGPATGFRLTRFPGIWLPGTQIQIRSIHVEIAKCWFAYSASNSQYDFFTMSWMNFVTWKTLDIFFSTPMCHGFILIWVSCTNSHL
jgi:hypothetical protein